MTDTTLEVPNYLQSEVVKWVDKIRSLDPSEQDLAKRRESLEEIAIQSAHLQGEFLAVMYMALHVIKKEGLWRTALDHNGQPYRRREDYDYDFMKNVQTVSIRTVNARQAQMDIFDSIGLETETQVDLLSKKPSISERALSVLDVHWNPETDEQEVTIAEDRKQEIEKALEIPQDGIGDKELAQEFLKAVAGMPHNEAGALVSRITQEWKRKIRYLPGEKVVEFSVFHMGKGYRKRELKSARFAFIGGELSHAEINRWLTGLI